jgi:hypothetical protein
MSAAALVAGGTLGLLANALEEMGASDSTIKLCQNLSVSLTGLSGILSILPALFGGTTLAL